jgi:hypothetical protein
MPASAWADNNMEIQALRLLVTEKALNELVARHLPDDQPVEELRFRLTPEGLHVSGEYPLFLRISFETHWELGVRDGNVTARLKRFKALGLPAPVFKSVLLKVLRETAGKESWLRFDGEDTILVLVDRLLAEKGIPLRTNLSAIRCQEGSLVLEAKAQDLSFQADTKR